VCMYMLPQALAADKAAAAHERELEVARLRALQEKVQDTRSQEDELRAKRYQVRDNTTTAPTGIFSLQDWVDRCLPGTSGMHGSGCCPWF